MQLLTSKDEIASKPVELLHFALVFFTLIREIFRLCAISPGVRFVALFECLRHEVPLFVGLRAKSKILLPAVNL